MFKNFCLVIIASIFCQSLIAQNAVVGSGFSSGWGGSSCPTGSTNLAYLNNSFGTSFGQQLTPSGTGNRYFRMAIDWSGTTAQRTINIGSDVIVSPGIEYTLNPSCTTSGALYINVPSATKKYFFKTFNAGTNPTGKFIVFEIEGQISQVSNVVTSPNSNVTNVQTVNISAILDRPLPSGQGVYLRYTTDNWASSTVVPMSGIDKLMQAIIPSQPTSTNVKYYVFTSGSGLVISGANADFYTINGNTNGGVNYQYTVTASPSVLVNPSYPTDTQSLMITFNATGTSLAGVTKVYCHAGASSNTISPTSFNHVTGNWGADDGVGEMVPVPGSPNVWQLTMPIGLRTYFNVPESKDIFGLNFLFRNAAGTLKVDNNGANYHNAVNASPYFAMTSPTTSSQTVQSGTNFTIQAVSSITTLSWVLKDTTTTPATTIHTASGSLNFSYTLAYPDAQTRKYKLIATYPSGTKYKTFDLIGYTPANELPRPTWTKKGINYHPADPTKATLVLHAPTFTQYKKGTGIISGTSNTTAKNIIYVIGDFNNWTPSEAYKMHRDRDGWNGTSDADGDNDRGDYWWIEISGLTPGQEYVFQYLIDGNLQVADPYTAKVSDPDDGLIPAINYPDLISYRPQAVDRASIIQTGNTTYAWTAPVFSHPDKKDLNIYELLFRDFTEEGTYLAAIDKLDYIKSLGINAIHVMPVSEFEGNSSWGYNPNFYFAADKAYGTSEDLKKFIDACHEKKILVFNDLVLNHAFYSNVMARMYWNSSANRPADENPWFNALHRMVRNPAGHWGADINHESEHTQAMVDSILGYWLHEYNFDGFRFDFTKGFGQTDPNDFPIGDDWASAYNQDRIDLLKRMVDRMWTYYPGSIAIFEHLADASEDKVLADHGILMWSGVGHHNALKNFILGYNTDNTNIYDSGVYNTPGRNFAQAHWMSYGESHDEERLGYELLQYYNGPRNTSTMIDRLKIAYGFNLLLPGPRMLWQFGEVGYDVNIDFNGRTGEKPVRWEYFDDAKRRELYRLIAVVLKARNKYNLYSTTPDYGNIGIGAGNITTPRVMRLSSNDNKHVIVVANLDPSTSHNVTPAFDVTGTWYRYNGVLDESSYTVTSANQNSAYTLAPSEMIVFTNFKVDNCTDVRSLSDNGPYTLRDAILCATDGQTITIDYMLSGDTIPLTNPIFIDKNLVINGFNDKSIMINGSTSTAPVFSISADKNVTFDGVKIKCSSENVQGRCIINQGLLKLINSTMHNSSSSSGSAIFNQGSGTIIIEKVVDVKD